MLHLPPQWKTLQSQRMLTAGGVGVLWHWIMLWTRIIEATLYDLVVVAFARDQSVWVGALWLLLLPWIILRAVVALQVKTLVPAQTRYHRPHRYHYYHLFIREMEWLLVHTHLLLRCEFSLPGDRFPWLIYSSIVPLLQPWRFRVPPSGIKQLIHHKDDNKAVLSLLFRLFISMNVLLFYLLEEANCQENMSAYDIFKLTSVGYDVDCPRSTDTSLFCFPFW